MNKGAASGRFRTAAKGADCAENRNFAPSFLQNKAKIKMKIEEKMAIDVVEALQALYGETIAPTSIQLQKTKREFEGHLTLVVFPFLRISRKKPEETAQEIGAYLKEHSNVVADFNVVKGFLNLCIDSAAWIDTLNDIHTAENYGLQPVTAAAPLVMI